MLGDSWERNGVLNRTCLGICAVVVVVVVVVGGGGGVCVCVCVCVCVYVCWGWNSGLQTCQVVLHW